MIMVGKTMNEYLVKMDVFLAAHDEVKTFKEMSKEEKQLYKDNEKPNIKVVIDNKSYEEFVEKIKVAETSARENRNLEKNRRPVATVYFVSWQTLLKPRTLTTIF